MTILLSCTTCPRTQVVASGAVAHAMTPEKLADIAQKIGWDVEWAGGGIKSTTCPECAFSSPPQSDKPERPAPGRGTNPRLAQGGLAPSGTAGFPRERPGRPDPAAH